MKKQLAHKFFVKGVTVAVLSGICYALYTSFVTVGASKGPWPDFYLLDGNAIIIPILVGALTSAVNDTVSAVWCLIIAAIKGKLGDFVRSIRTKPGMVMVVCALCGGPIASTAYLVAIPYAGFAAAPITALCPAIGAILGRILFKQQLNARMVVGVFTCVSASIIIGSGAFAADAPPNMLLGCLIALIAAFGWGLEGCVAGYGTTLIDYEIGITIRQTTSGLSNLIILVPLLSIMAGNIGFTPELIGKAVSSGPAMIFFLISGFCAVFAYSLWYKGNSMCGAALGMACNGAYSFWTPLFMWLVCGLLFKMEAYEAPPSATAGIGAIVMFVGVCLIAFNPLELLGRKKEVA
jgi:drug/metabolite transporter (DMT)-like permease